MSVDASSRLSSESRAQGSTAALHRRPKVSLCIPAFQAELYLQATIDSALAQDYGDFEVVIVDNNSSDGTRDILESVNDERVRVIRNRTTLPMADNFNLAVRHCDGDFVKLVCADDTLEPDCLTTQVAITRTQPGRCLGLGADQLHRR